MQAFLHVGRDRMSLTRDIKEYAFDLGYSRVGITTADNFQAYHSELSSRYDQYSFYIEAPRQPLKGADPRGIMPSARSIISVAYDYSKESFPIELSRMIGRLYLARAYDPPTNRINGARRELMKEFLKRNGLQVGEGICLPERLAAARSGITTYGKNNFAYADGIGSFIVLSSFVVDVELEYDQPTVELKCPDDCRACMDACPTGAIYEPLKLNPRLCIAYNNFWTNGRPGVSSCIPIEIREKMGLRIHGCDACQEVCPRNKKRLSASLPQNEFLVAIADDFCLSKVLNMSDEFFEKRVQPLMYNYIKEKKYFQRNAAIALGNLGDPGYVPDLSRAMLDPEDVVREYAAWALGKIGGKESKQALEASLGRKTSDQVKKEIQSALAMN
jgi:epoxyqueuosine reductase